MEHDPETCPRAIQLTERVSHHDVSIGEVKRDNENQWNEINWLKRAMTKQVPVWVSVVMMAMSFITGAALTYAGMCMRLAGK